MSIGAGHKFDAVLFDLLTALLDSGTLWNIVAGNPEDGRKWRAAYLRRTYAAGAYRPYEALVAEVSAKIVEARAEARARHGWIMDSYIIRRGSA